ncbi:MAG: phosphate regulon transcriptional regulator PhoB, partial [Pseudomonadota bacterium]
MNAYILIVEDEAGIRELLQDALSAKGFTVTAARNAQAANAAVENQLPDLAIVDWMMPQISGIELIRQWRREARTQDIPIIMLTARGTEEDTITGLDAGADDYIGKPFSTRELIARVNAMLRRAGAVDDVLTYENLQLDTGAHRVTVDGSSVNLGQTEYKLLGFLLAHPDRVYTRAQLLDHVWGVNHYVEERTVDVHILRLRKALREHHKDHIIETVRGAGYRL